MSKGGVFPGAVPAGTSRMPGATKPQPVTPTYPGSNVGADRREQSGLVSKYGSATFRRGGQNIYGLPSGIAPTAANLNPTKVYPGMGATQFQAAQQGQARQAQAGQDASAARWAGLAAGYTPGVPTSVATGAPRQTVTEAGVTFDPRSALADAARYTGTALDLAVKQNRPDWRPNQLSETLVAELPIQMWGYTDMKSFLNDFGYAPDPNRPGVWNRLDAAKPTVTGSGSGYGGYGGYGDYNDGGGWNDYGGGWGGYGDDGSYYPRYFSGGDYGGGDYGGGGAGGGGRSYGGLIQWRIGP